MKKCISILVVVMMILSTLTTVPFTTHALEDDDSDTIVAKGFTGDCEWTLDCYGELTIFGSGSIGNYDNLLWGPDIKTVVMIGVTAIGEGSFNGCSELTTISIPGSVLSIGDYAFSGCSKLTSVSIGSAVETIGDGAFNNCNNLTYVTIPKSVKSIGNYAFARCGSLSSVTISGSVINIGDCAFLNCSSLTDVTIPDSVKSIGDLAFGMCTGLISVTIGSSVTSIGNDVFSGCDSLESITVAKSNPLFDSRNNCNAIIETESNTLKYGCGNTVIPDSVVSIGNGAFHNCNNLFDLTIPDSVTSIGQFSFESCSKLRSATIGDSVTSIGKGAFSGCTVLTKVCIGNAVETIGDIAFGGCTSLPSIYIPASVISIGNSAFDCCSGKLTDKINSNLMDISVDDKNPVYRSIDGNLYNKTASILIQYAIGKTADTFVIPETVTCIGNEAFQHCNNLSYMIIPDSVRMIGDSAFTYCLYMKKVTISDSVTSIGNEAFSFCYSLTSVTIPNSVVSIGNHVFTDCRALKSVTIGGTTTGYGTFDSCYGLTSVTIGNSVTKIEDMAFAYCYSLSNIAIPDSVTSIGDSVFSDCFNLRIIYGYTGTVAEAYASDNGYTFVPLINITDHPTGVLVSVPEDVSLVVEKSTEYESFDLPDDTTATVVYNIALTKGGETVQPDCVITVRIPCDNENAKVYRQEAEGSLVDMNANYKDGYLEFTTDHFSVYIVAVPNEEKPILGDADGNGAVNVFDASYILKALTGTNGYPDITKLDKSDRVYRVSDIDGSGTVNVFDAALILKYISGDSSAQRYGIGENIK